MTAPLCMNGNICLRALPLAGFNPKNGQLDSLFLVFWWWFAVPVVCLHRLRLHYRAIVPNSAISGGDLWWFAVVCLFVVPPPPPHQNTNLQRGNRQIFLESSFGGERRSVSRNCHLNKRVRDNPIFFRHCILFTDVMKRKLWTLVSMKQMKSVVECAQLDADGFFARE